MREFVKHIAESLRNDDDQWTLDEYRLRSRKLGVAVWVANGFFFLNFEHVVVVNGRQTEIKTNLSLREKFAIWRAVRKCQKKLQMAKDAKILEAVVSRRLSTEQPPKDPFNF